MNAEIMETLCHEYRELQRMQEDLTSELEALRAQIIEHMDTAEFAPPEYSESERRAQFDRLTEENPVSIFEGVSL